MLIVLPEQTSSSADFEFPVPAAEVVGMRGNSPEKFTTTSSAIAPALPFVAHYGDGASPLRAEDCLTQAIYFEGALEPDAGQRAIAQVVLNRVRHPQYPNSVCGVVFEGHHRPTGCQFTFTCDGSRARGSVASLWRRANLVAKAALGGAVAKDVGLSTHYHADYVLPYWSKTLDVTGQIGQHIFYRWRGNAGRPQAFSSIYSGREPLIGEWAQGTVRTELAESVGIALTLEGETPDPTIGAIDGEVMLPAQAPFKPRPLRLTTKQSQLQ